MILLTMMYLMMIIKTGISQLLYAELLVRVTFIWIHSYCDIYLLEPLEVHPGLGPGHPGHPGSLA